MRYLALIFTIFLLGVDAAHSVFQPFTVYSEGSIDVRACSFTLFKAATFCEKQTAKAYGCFCKNKNAMASLAGCVQVINPHPQGTFEWFADQCGKKFNTSVKAQDFVDSLDYLKEHGKNFTAVPKSSAPANSTSSNSTSNSTTSGQAKQALPLTPISRAEKPKGPPMVTYPVYVNVTLAHAYSDAYQSQFGNFNWSYYFSDALYAYWLFVFTIAGVCNWSVVIFPSLRGTCNGRISKMWRQYVTLPALIRKKKTNHQPFLGLFSFLVPSRLETLVLSGFFWLTFLFNALYMDWKPGNPLYATRYDAVLRYVADRTGIIGTMLIPLLILIGGRNNFLQWLTKWKFSTFVLYHRWIGRVIVSLVFIHSLNYAIRAINNNNFTNLMQKEYVIYGIVATVAGGVICFQGLLFLRRKFYEVFLAIHILMAIAFLLGAWEHLEGRVMEWIFAAVAVWAFDRFVRLVRIAWFGVPKANVTLLADDCLRVTVPKPSHWPSVPGGHAWVYFCHSWFFWQSHPFTFLDSTVEENKIVFILKTKRGATHYITKMLAKLPGKTATIRVCVEGPYGEACPVKSHDNVVFVAGGNGIPGIFSECYDLARKSTDMARQKIKLVWILREISTIEWVWGELLALKDIKVEATIYITRPEGGNEQVLLERMLTRDDSSSEEKELSKEGKNILDMLNDHFPHITFKCGRPSMDAIVDEEVEHAVNSAAFITCGHPVMVDDLRYAVVQKIDKTEKRLDFFEQLQVWA